MVQCSIMKGTRKRECVFCMQDERIGNRVGRKEGEGSYWPDRA